MARVAKVGFKSGVVVEKMVSAALFQALRTGFLDPNHSGLIPEDTKEGRWLPLEVPPSLNDSPEIVPSGLTDGAEKFPFREVLEKAGLDILLAADGTGELRPDDPRA